MFTKKISAVAILIIFCSLLLQTAYGGKSVFIISSHDYPSGCQAYSIEGDEVVYQADVNISTYNPGVGPVGIAVWPEKELAFFTFETSPMIVWSSTETLQKVDELNTGVSNLAGIVVDKGNEKIYVVERGSANLRIYSWSVPNTTLVLDSVQVLQGLEPPSPGAFGLALDETNGRLYVSDNTVTVRYYNTNTWAYQGSIDVVVSGNDRPAVGIAVDPAGGYLYTGNFSGGGGSHNCLVRTNLSSPYTSIETDIGDPVIGIDVDESTGLVYCTTHAYYGQYTSDFRVYNSSLTLLDVERNDGIESPAGVAIGGWYKTASFLLSKDDNDANCVLPQNYITYSICWDANGFGDTNVAIFDYLPDEVEYYSASGPNSSYDDVNHIVTWDIGNIDANDSNCVTVKVKVTAEAEAGGTITNYCEIEGDNYSAVDSNKTCVACWRGNVLYVDANTPDNNDGFSWQTAYEELQDALDAASADSCIEVIWVAAGTYKPANDINDPNYKDKSFELVEDVGLVGHFEGNETSPGERDLADTDNETILEGKIGASSSDAVKYVVKGENIDANAVIVDGFTVRGGYDGAGIYLNDANVGIVNCKIKDNESNGVYAENGSYPDIHNCTFIDNFGGDQSYGLYADSSWSEVSYCDFNGNSTTDDGIYMSDGVMTVSDCNFKKHSGSGIYGESGTLTINKSTFDDNSDGLVLDNVGTTMTDCNVMNSKEDGVRSDTYGDSCNSLSLTAKRTVFKNNGRSGIFLYDCNGFDIEHCVIRNSGAPGIYLYQLEQNSDIEITNSWIHNNGINKDAYWHGGAGICFTFEEQSDIPEVRNNTIYDNNTYGIEYYEYVEYDVEPNIRNCIITDNNSGDLSWVNSFNKVNYCLLQSSHDGVGNKIGDPCFMNIDADANDLHLASDSNCVDTGDPNYPEDANEFDIDGEGRIKYGRVDIGGDEYYWSPADFDEDEEVNFMDYEKLAAAWGSEPNDDDYNEVCDLNDNNTIDIKDLALFCEDWLWEAGWVKGVLMRCMGGGMGFGLESKSILESSRDALMLSAAESLRTRPERLAAKSQKFYDIRPVTTIDATKAGIEVDVKEILEWLDEIWLNGDLKEHMTEEEYLEFRKIIEESWPIGF